MFSSEEATRPRWWRSVALLLALSLAAAACGSGDAGSAAPTLAPSSDSSADDSSATETAAADDSAAAGGADASAAEPAVNLFPDIDVLSVTDGSSVNLAAELGGSDKATLLWFWAPH